jgi:hypothetical protein
MKRVAVVCIVSILSGFAILTTLVSAGCASSDRTAQASAGAENVPVLANTKCPIMGSEVDPSGPTRQFKGATIGFCCPGCDRKWDSKSDGERMALLARRDPEAMKRILAAGSSSTPAVNSR